MWEEGTQEVRGPNRIARVTSPGRLCSPKVVGMIGNHECEMTVDSGDLLTMVRDDMVKEEEYTGEMVTLRSVCGQTFQTREARVWLHFGDYSIHHNVAVSSKLSEAVLLSIDLGLLEYLLKLEKDKE